MKTITGKDLREIELTINNTEHLYSLARNAKDLSLDSGSDIDDIYTQTVAQIVANGGQAPVLNTDFDVKRVFELVKQIVREIKDEVENE